MPTVLPTTVLPTTDTVYYYTAYYYTAYYYTAYYCTAYYYTAYFLALIYLELLSSRKAVLIVTSTDITIDTHNSRIGHFTVHNGVGNHCGLSLIGRLSIFLMV